MEKLRRFRQQSYEALGKAKDATFELMDAILLSPKVSSYAELSLSPVFRRQWPSIYEALEDTCPEREKLMKHYIAHIPKEPRILLVGDHSSWSRPEAVTLRERTYEHGGGGIGGGKPITLGQGYSTIAWIPEKKGSWALPLRHERITSFDTPLSLAAYQLRQVCQELKVRPVSLWDSEYGNASFLRQTQDIEADKLIRLRPNRCVWGVPPSYSGKGRPPKHGTKFKLNDSTTWPETSQTAIVEDPKWGQIQIQHWNQFHFRQEPELSFEVVRVSSPETSASLKPLWLAWVGGTLPSLETLYLLYLRRFTIEHWYRFLKQRLHWCLPKLGTPEQSEHWSDLMPILTWSLWLAREVVSDRPLPWQKPLSPSSLSPGRVAQSMGSILTTIGTPARAPKPRGKSPGWTKGTPRAPRKRYPIVKKGRGRFQSYSQPHPSSA